MENKMINLVTQCYENLNNIFRDEEEKSYVIKYDLENVTEEFFTAELLALKLQFEKLTGNDGDLLDFIAILNKLAFQHLTDKDDEERDAE